jgi:hypothetical protein
MSKPTPVTIAIRHPGAWPLAFGPYATGGAVHQVDPATAARLLARGFERVSDAEPSAAADATHQPAGAVASAAQAITLFPADPASED